MGVDDLDEVRTHPTEEDVSRLEEFVATRSQHLTLLQPRITLLAADLPEYDVTRKLKASASHSKSKKVGLRLQINIHSIHSSAELYTE